MKRTIIFSKVITHKVTVDADSFDDAREIAHNMVNNNEVDFTADDIAAAGQPIEFAVIEEVYKMTLTEKANAVKSAAQRTRYHISGGELTRGYWYGQNPYADMLIECALMYDMFPEEATTFRRSDYSLSRAI